MHPEWQDAVDSTVFHYLEDADRLPSDVDISDFSIPLYGDGSVNEELLDTELISVEEVEGLMSDLEDGWAEWAANDGYYEKVVVDGEEILLYISEDRSGYQVSDVDDWYVGVSPDSGPDAFEACKKVMCEAGLILEER